MRTCIRVFVLCLFVFLFLAVQVLAIYTNYTFVLPTAFAAEVCNASYADLYITQLNTTQWNTAPSVHYDVYSLLKIVWMHWVIP